MNKPAPSFNVNHRETLSWAFGLSVGSVLAGCGGGSSVGPTFDTLPDPQMLAATNKLLSMDLNAQYASQSMTIAYQQDPGYPGAAKKKPPHCAVSMVSTWRQRCCSISVTRCASTSSTSSRPA